jgi:hypothetical protein
MKYRAEINVNGGFSFTFDANNDKEAFAKVVAVSDEKYGGDWGHRSIRIEQTKNRETKQEGLSSIAMAFEGKA